MKVLSDFNQLLPRIKGRMLSDAQIVKDSGKLIKKVVVQLNQLPDHSIPQENDADSEVPPAVEELTYNGVNLLKLGGINDSEKVKRIALEMFTRDEIRKVVIDSRRTANARQKADEQRTELFKRAVRSILGSRYSEARYRYLLSSVNQIGLNMRDENDE